MFEDLEFRMMVLWKGLPPDIQNTIDSMSQSPFADRNTGFTDKLISLELAGKYLRKEIEWKRKQQLMEKTVTRFLEGFGNIMTEFVGELSKGYTKLAKTLSDSMERQALLTIEQNNRTYELMGMMVESVKEQAVTNAELKEIAKKVESKSHPSLPVIADCVYQHPQLPKTPQRCLYTWHEGGKMYQVCFVPQHANTRRILNWMWIDARKDGALWEGGCPLFESLGIIKRYFPYQRCRLADGRVHVVELREGTKTTFQFKNQDYDVK